MSKPLKQLKNKHILSDKEIKVASQSIEQIKEALFNLEVLHTPKVNLPIYVNTNASKDDISCTLFQLVPQLPQEKIQSTY